MKHRLQKQIKKLQSMKKWMQQQRNKIQIAEQTDFSKKIEITTYPDCYYLYREAEPNSNQSFSKNLNKLISLLQKDQSLSGL